MACPIEPAIYLLAVLDNTEVGDCCNDNKGLNRLEQQHTSFSCFMLAATQKIIVKQRSNFF